MPTKTGFWLSWLMIPCLGAMILAMLCLLPGCGSDSAPLSKKEKAAKSSGSSNLRKVMPLLTDDDGAGLKSERSPKGGPQEQMFPGMPPMDELRARAAAEGEKRDPARVEVFSGLSLKQLDAKLEAQRAKPPNPKQEILPGLTQEQLDTKVVEARKVRSGQTEIFPGLTEAEVQERAAQARQRRESEGLRPEQMFLKK